jgi:hypothetical protein
MIQLVQCVKCNTEIFDRIFIILDSTTIYSQVNYKKLLDKMYLDAKIIKRLNVLAFVPEIAKLYTIISTIVNTFLTGNITKHDCSNYSYEFFSGFKYRYYFGNKCDFCVFVEIIFLQIKSCDELLMKIVKRDDLILRVYKEVPTYSISYTIKLIDYESILDLANMLSLTIYYDVSDKIHIDVKDSTKTIFIEYIRTKYMDIVKKMQFKYIDTKIPVELYQEEQQELTEKDINDDKIYLS